MIKICFVCTGNTCRSVMAERLAKKQLKALGLKNVKLSSRGLSASGENIAENAKIALKTLGASGANRKSVKLGRLDKSTLYVTMTEAQKGKLQGCKVISLGQLLGQDIADPYGQSEEVYLQTAKKLQQGVEILLRKLRENL